MGRVTHLLTDTITVAHETSRDGSGDPSYGSQITMAARVEEIDGIAFGVKKNEATVRHKVAVEEELVITDRIWLPWDNPADDTVAKKPVSVTHARFPGETEGLYEVVL
jgi:hypothetical protein